MAQSSLAAKLNFAGFESLTRGDVMAARKAALTMLSQDPTRQQVEGYGPTLFKTTPPEIESITIPMASSQATIHRTYTTPPKPPETVHLTLAQVIELHNQLAQDSGQFNLMIDPTA